MGVDTKQRILDVAEELFADFGFATTSLRDITSAAGVNLASVNYHFGSKEALLAAVMARRFAPLNERRLERLGEAESRAGAEGPTLEEILRAFIAPPFEMRAEWGTGGNKFVRLLGRVHVETNEEFRASFINQFTAIFTRFADALRRALPGIEPSDLNCRFWFLIGSMAHTMMWAESSSKTESDQDPEEVLEALIQFGVAGLSAPARQPVAVRSKRVKDR